MRSVAGTPRWKIECHTSGRCDARGRSPALNTPLGYDRRMTRATLDIQGMSCASCAAGIEKRLGTLDGVDECAVNFATHQAAVDFDPERVDTDRLIAAVEDVGYGA